MDTAQGWPFLIARGRSRGYSVLLAPDFLVARGDYGFLEDVAGPLPHGTPFRATTVRREHGDVGVVWSDYPTNLRDEHSRPLRLLAGFTCTGTISRPSELDLDAARTVALRTFERFLRDEHGFTTESAAPFAAHSAVLPAARNRLPRRLAPVAVLSSVLVALAVVLLLVLISRPGGPPTRTVPPCATPTLAVAAQQTSCLPATTTIKIRKGPVTP